MAHLVPVDDPSDPRLRDFTDLTDVALRRVREPAEGLFMAEGATVILRALAAGYPMRAALASPRWADELLAALPPGTDAPVYVGPPELLERVTGFHVHRGALASMQRKPERSVDEVVRGADRLLVVEDVVNHTNVGAIFRSAAGLGMDGVLLSPTCADPLYRRAVRVSMGTVLAVPYARVPRWPDGLTDLRAAGFTVLALTPDPDAVPLADLTPEQLRRCALVLGTEGDGLADLTQEAADVRVRIPMAHGVDSLNVAAAAAVACYAVAHG